MNWEEEVAWSKRLMGAILIGGTWGVPRSGLLFTKKADDELALSALVPWTKEIGEAFADGRDVPPTKEKLLEFQRDEFECIAKRFIAAGCKVTDPHNLLK